MTTDDRTTLDIGAFLDVVRREVNAGIAAAHRPELRDRPLAITRVRVRIGFDPPGGGESTGPDPAIEDPLLPASVPWHLDVRSIFG